MDFGRNLGVNRIWAFFGATKIRETPEITCKPLNKSKETK
jgi:hypothetical protein